MGKTAAGIRIAKDLGAEIISADSRQFYRQMEIGTAKPTLEERGEVTHYFVDNLDLQQDYNVGKFEREALARLEKLFAKSRYAVLVGGSGLYVKALCDGIDDMPAVDPNIRNQLRQQKEEKGIAFLAAQLQEKDPEYAAIADLKNPQRLVRALEIIESTGRTYTSFREVEKNIERPFKVLKIGLELPREVLYDRINRRMDLMIEAGLFEEAERLYPYRDLNALQTVGYREIFGYLDGLYDREEAVRLLKRNSRRYAKRQLTWFKKDEATRWFTPDSLDEILEYIRKSSDV